MTVQPSHGLSEEEVERLVLESVEHARADFTARRLIQLRNKAESEVRHTDKALAAHGDKLSLEQRQRIDAALARVRQAIQGEDVNRLQEAADELASATVLLAEVQMNAVVRSTLQGKVMEEVRPEKL